MAIAVEVQELSKRYGRTVALERVTFHLEPGSVLGLVGPNGAGKSTLLRMLLGLTRPTEGAIYYDGQSLWPDPSRAMRGVGGFVDRPSFYSYLSGRDNLRMLAEMTGVARVRVDAVLHAVHLTEAAGMRVGGYSHGKHQRLGIAAALLKSPGLMILDEPQDGLDPARLEEMRQLLGRVRRDLGTTIIMSSHVIRDVERLCDRIAVFSRGCLRYVGPSDQLGTLGAEEVEWDVYPTDGAILQLVKLGIKARVADDGKVTAPWNPRWDLGAVNAALVKQGILLRTVMRQEVSLEARLLTYWEDYDVDVR